MPAASFLFSILRCYEPAAFFKPEITLPAPYAAGISLLAGCAAHVQYLVDMISAHRKAFQFFRFFSSSMDIPPIVAMLVLILATWTTNTGNAYMSGLAACKMFSIKDSKRPLVTMICGVLGVIMAIAGLADFLNTYISILGAVVPPIMGVVICDYWVICKAKKENWSPVRGINWIGIIAWVIGGGFALLETLGVVTVFSSALDGVIIAFVAYWILYSLLKNTKLAGSGDMTIEEAGSVAQ